MREIALEEQRVFAVRSPQGNPPAALLELAALNYAANLSR
jgi:hypothetical protein